jgi:hypothetical protein
MKAVHCKTAEEKAIPVITRANSGHLNPTERTLLKVLELSALHPAKPPLIRLTHGQNLC